MNEINLVWVIEENQTSKILERNLLPQPIKLIQQANTVGYEDFYTIEEMAESEKKR